MKQVSKLKLKYQTWLITYDNGFKAIRHHNTDVITWNTNDNTVSLNNGGYYSSTTKARINIGFSMFCNNKYRLNQKNYTWFISESNTGISKEYSNNLVLKA
jgi:hypothetical protein